MLHAQTCVLCFLDVVQISFSINGDPSCAHELAPFPFVFCRMDENSAFNRWISVLGSVGGFCGLKISLNSYFRVLGAVSKPVILLTIVREGDEPFRISLNIREFISCVFIIIIL